MMRKSKQSRKRRPHGASATLARRQAISRLSGSDEWRDDREEVDSDFDAVDIDDVVRQARHGRVNIAELDAL